MEGGERRKGQQKGRSRRTASVPEGRERREGRSAGSRDSRRRGASADENISSLRAVGELREQIEEQRRQQREARAARARQREERELAAVIRHSSGVFSPGGTDSDSELGEVGPATRQRGEEPTVGAAPGIFSSAVDVTSTPLEERVAAERARLSVSASGRRMAMEGGRRPMTPLAQSRAEDAAWGLADPDFLDEEFREEWWVDEGERRRMIKCWAVVAESWQEVVVYLINGELRVLTVPQYKDGRRRAREAGVPETANSPSLCQGAKRYLEGYRRRSGKLPTASTWTRALEGQEDSAGDSVGAWFYCSMCRKWNKAPFEKSEAVDTASRLGMTTCAGIVGRRCGLEEMEREKRVKEERVEEEVEEDDSVELVGFSPQARQFYKTASKYLRTPSYTGSSAEVDFVAWQRGAERYFETYGITKELEKVAIAADLLEGEALTWWNGMFISGRHQEVRTWERLKELLKERFIPPEGEMITVGKWRRARQIGPVASYSDYIHKLKALCDMGEAAEFRLAFYGLRPELQAEVRRQLRVTGEKTMPLERMFAVATDAEIGLGLRQYKGKEGEGKEEKRKEMGGERKGRVYQLTGKEQEGRRRERSERMEDVVCLVCDQKGHWWFYCEQRKRGGGCARCGSHTHRVVNCPQLPSRAPKGQQGKQLVATLQAQLLQVAGAPRTAQLLYFPVRLGKAWVEVMIDSGASVNCIDELQLARVGGTLRPVCPGVLYYPDQRQAAVKGTATMMIEAKGFRDTVTFWVVRGLGVPVLLGEPWLRYWNPRIDWQERELRFSDGVRWKAKGGGKKGGEEEDKKIRGKVSTRATLRALTNGEKEERKQQEVPEWIAEFDDVFAEPVVAKLTTKTKHTIRLKEGARPYQKAPYRLAVDQREALEQEIKEFRRKG